MGSIATGWFNIISSIGNSGAKIGGSSEFSTLVDSDGTVRARFAAMIAEEGSNEVNGGSFGSA
jgi:hypothetical protein